MHGGYCIGRGTAARRAGHHDPYLPACFCARMHHPHRMRRPPQVRTLRPLVSQICVVSASPLSAKWTAQPTHMYRVRRYEVHLLCERECVSTTFDCYSGVGCRARRSSCRARHFTVHAHSCACVRGVLSSHCWTVVLCCVVSHCMAVKHAVGCVGTRCMLAAELLRRTEAKREERKAAVGWSQRPTCAIYVAY